MLPQVLDVEVIRRDGSVGTVLKATLLSPGNPSPATFTEEVGYEKYVKETRVFEGDFQKLGFVKYGFRFEIIEKGPSASVIKSSVVYDARPELSLKPHALSLWLLERLYGQVSRWRWSYSNKLADGAGRVVTTALLHCM